jgi:hypothetical protein
MNSKIFGWLFTQHDEMDRLRERVRILEEDIERRKVSYIAREEANAALRKELQLQRVLIDALRNVNASLDARCNDLERVRQ